VRRFAWTWLAATGTVAGAAAALAWIAWSRSQYPLLTGFEACALAARWAADVAGVALVAGGAIAVALRVVGVRAYSVPLGAALAIAFVGASLATRGTESLTPADPAAVSLPPPIEPHPAPPGAPNIVLVTIDTLRADHLDAYGYARPTSPSLDAFAKDGVLFETAISAAPATQLSTASLLTGLWPVTHMEPMRDRPEGVAFLRSGFTTLAEHLAAAGYATAGFVSNPALRAEEGFAQGFATWDDTTGRDAEAEGVIAPAIEWLATARAPFFLWVHLLDPHHPYDPPELGPWEDPSDAAAAALRRTWTSLPFAEQTARMQRVERSSDLDPATRAFLVDRYDTEIRHADAGVGRLLASLERQGATRANTWVAVTADHGEEFLDHGRLLHSHTLYDELLHVPLIVRGPTTPAGLRVAEQVPTIALMPTLLAAAGQSTAELDERSLAPFWERPGQEPPRGAMSERDSRYIAWRADGHKLVVASLPAPFERAPVGGIEALRWMARASLAREPRQRVGYWAIGSEPDRVRLRVAPGLQGEARRAEEALVAALAQRTIRDVPEDAPRQFDAAAVEQLRALGYAR
jgi:arylsulfatase